MDAQRWGWQRPDAHGSVLIVVVWTIALLSVLAAALGSRGVFALGLTERLDHQLQASYIALGGVQQAIAVLTKDTTPELDGVNDNWASRADLFANQPFGAGSFTIQYPGSGDPSTPVYGLIDEERKLNLNTMPAAVFERLLEAVGQLDERTASIVAQSIEDWRDEDKEAHEDGAENFYYLDRDPPYACKDGKFENVEELQFVRGMTPEVFRRVAPYVTVYGSGQVNVNTASPEVLQALGLSTAGVNAVVFYRAGEDNTPWTTDDRMFISVAAVGSELSTQLTKDDVKQLNRAVVGDLLTVHSEAFRVLVTAATPNATSPVHVECVVDRKGHVEAWFED